MSELTNDEWETIRILVESERYGWLKRTDDPEAQASVVGRLDDIIGKIGRSEFLKGTPINPNTPNDLDPKSIEEYLEQFPKEEE